MMDLCATCTKEVKDDDEAVTCDECDTWNHIKCKTGISSEDYKRCLSGKMKLSFICCKCKCIQDVNDECLRNSFSLLEIGANGQSSTASSSDDKLPSPPPLPLPPPPSPPSSEISASGSLQLPSPPSFSIGSSQSLSSMPACLSDDESDDAVFDELRAEMALDRSFNISFEGSQRTSIEPLEKVVRKPFVQLLSVHAFVTKDECMKQVPLFFVLMSRRTKDDYIAVFQKIKELLGSFALESAVLDFEKAAWIALNEVFPCIELKGCVFHLTQAIFRKIQELGLSCTYSKKSSIYHYCRKPMALAFLPHTLIEDAFLSLKELANSTELRKLCSYIEQTWFNSTVWSVRQWCVYRRTVRTNNDVEGWHQRLNKKAKKSNLPMYLLIHLLKVEANLVDVQVALVHDGLLRRRHRSGYSHANASIYELWNKLDDHMINTSGFLRECGAIYGPKVLDSTSD